MKWYDKLPGRLAVDTRKLEDSNKHNVVRSNKILNRCQHLLEKVAWAGHRAWLLALLTFNIEVQQVRLVFPQHLIVVPKVGWGLNDEIVQSCRIHDAAKLLLTRPACIARNEILVVKALSNLFCDELLEVPVAHGSVDLEQRDKIAVMLQPREGHYRTTASNFTRVAPRSCMHSFDISYGKCS